MYYKRVAPCITDMAKPLDTLSGCDVALRKKQMKTCINTSCNAKLLKHLHGFANNKMVMIVSTHEICSMQ
jgi:hypothetical protein